MDKFMAGCWERRGRILKRQAPTISVGCEISHAAKFSQPTKIQPTATDLPLSTLANKNTKNYENEQLKMRKITKKVKLKLRKLCKITDKTESRRNKNSTKFGVVFEFLQKPRSLR